MKAVKWLDAHLEEALLVVFLVLISFVTLINVICTNIPGVGTLPWAEEFCRFIWIWSVFVSLPYTIRAGSMLRVSVVLDLMPQVVRKVLNIAVDAIIIASMALLGFYSIQVVQGIIASGETSPAMILPMWIVYISMLFGFILGTLRGIQMLIIHVQHFGEKELTTMEQTMADAAAEADAGKRAEGGDK